MKRKLYYILTLIILAALTGCKDYDELYRLAEIAATQPVSAELVVTVSNDTGSSSGSSTRMSSGVVQADGNFRGLKSLMVFPFTTNGQPVTVDNVPQIPTITTTDDAGKVDNKDYYYWSNCEMMRGTDRILAWGQAKEISGQASLDKNGKLETTLTGRMLLDDITFSLKSISETDNAGTSSDDCPEAFKPAWALADYLTAIANAETPTEKWSTTDNASLKALYLDFINANSESTGLMAGSAAHVKAYVQALKNQLTSNTDALSTAIIAKIDNSSIEDNSYPSSLGLPDGAAALRWTDGAFAVRTQTTTLDNINSIIRYTYPAELWYYVNSGIYTSSEEVTKTTYEENAWDNLLTTYYQSGRSVNGSTKSVAVEWPLQYGVGRLEMTLAAIPATLKDSKNEDVSISSKDKMPLKAVIIGAQHTVGFDFKPKRVQSDVDARFIYDTVVGSADATTGNYTVNTLVLQTYDGEKVPILLEFENKTNLAFAGKDGIIYPDTKFYLIAQIDPASVTEPAVKPDDYDDIKKRVFTQDHTTTITMTVASLANAYSCMPDLLAPRLEIGVQVVTQWIQPTTTTVIL